MLPWAGGGGGWVQSTSCIRGCRTGGPWRSEETEGGGTGRRLWPQQPAIAGGNRGNLCGQRGGPPLGREAGREGAQPAPPPPGEREALCPGWAAAEGGGEKTPGPPPGRSPSEGRVMKRCPLILCPLFPQVVGCGGAGYTPLPGGRWGDPRSPSGVMDPAVVLPLFGECCWLRQLYGTWVPAGAVLQAEELPGDRCVEEGCGTCVSSGL